MKIQPKKEDRAHDIAIEDARHSIDEQIRELEQAFLKSVLSLKRKRNALAPISKLPPEILLAIFKLTILLELDSVTSWLEPYGPPRPVASLTWRCFIKIAHVCHSWREIVISSPRLWSQPIFSSEEVAKEMLFRSKSSPVLDVRLNEALLPRNFRENILTPLSPSFLDVSRLENFHLWLPSRRLDQVIKRLSGGSEARNMRSLYIVVTGFGARYCVPSAFFSINMPHLRQLDIRVCDLPWDSLDAVTGAHPGFPELEALTLWEVSMEWPKLYRMLAGTPKLRRLSLRDTNLSPSPFSPTEVSSDVIQLPNLSFCNFEAFPSRCLDFQRHVSYPVMGTKFRFLLSFDPDAVHRDTAVSESSALFDTLRISRNNPLASHTNLLYSIHDYKAAITIWDEPFPSYSELSIPICSADRSIVFVTHNDIPPLKFLQIRGLKNVEFRVHRREPPFTAHDFSFFFEAHTELSHISISSYDMGPLFSALSRCRHDHGGDSDPQQPPSPPICDETCTPLPHLHSIMIAMKRGKSFSDLCDLPEETEAIYHALLVRSRCGLPVKTLKVMQEPGSSFSESVARKIGEIVEEFSQEYSEDLP